MAEDTRMVRGVLRTDLPDVTTKSTGYQFTGSYGNLPGWVDTTDYAYYAREQSARKAGYDSYADQVAFAKASNEYMALLESKPADFSFKFTTNKDGYTPTTAEMQQALKELKDSIELEPRYNSAAKAYAEIEKPAGFSYKFTYNPTKAQATKEYEEAITGIKTKRLTDKYKDVLTPFNKFMTQKHNIQDNPFTPNSENWYEKEAANALNAQIKQRDWHNAEKQRLGKPLGIQSIMAPYVQPTFDTSKEQRAWHEAQKSINGSAKVVGKYGKKKPVVKKSVKKNSKKKPTIFYGI